MESPLPLLFGSAEAPELAPPPRDPYNRVLLSLGLQGVGALFAWNAIITPTNYYELRFADSPFRDSFESLLSVTFTGVGLLSIAALQTVQHLFSLRAGIIGALAAQLTVFALLSLYTLLPVFQSDEGLRTQISQGATASFYVTVVCTAVAAAAQALLTSSVVAYTSVFPPAYTKVYRGATTHPCADSQSHAPGFREYPQFLL